VAVDTILGKETPEKVLQEEKEEEQ